MKKYRKLFMLITIFLVIIFTSNYVFYSKLTTGAESRQVLHENHLLKNLNIEEKILKYSKCAHKLYKRRRNVDNITSSFIENIHKKYEFNNYTYTWKLANSWVSKKHLVDPLNVELGRVYTSLKYAQIIKSDLDTRGTQLKFLLELEGGQKVVFKPKWYDKFKVIKGHVYAGKDRHTSELLAFYLSIILNQPFTPFSVHRIIHLSEILQVATDRLLETTLSVNNSTCIYGKCFYCSKKDAICPENSTGAFPGVVIFNINSRFKTIRSPWVRTYKINKSAFWQTDHEYCKNHVMKNVSKNWIAEMVDVSIFDFLIQNGDRHHLEFLENKIVLVDNGKGLGNPFKHHLDVLAPLYQCCIIRKSTWHRLLGLNNHKLSEYLKQMPDIEIINEAHLKAIDERLLLIYGAVEYCKNEEKMIFMN